MSRGSEVDMAPFVNLEKILSISPVASTIDRWVDQLAVDQSVIVAHDINKAHSVFLQSDHAPDGSLAKVLTYFDINDKSKTPDGSVQQFFLGIEVTGKKAGEIAEGIDHSLKSIGLSDLILAGITSDSGAGSPESSYNALLQINRASPHGTADSCGLHDMQSIFRLPVKQFTGSGGLDKRDAIQYIHAVYDMFKCFRNLKGNWRDLVEVIWEDLNTGREVPKNLLLSIQKSLMTRWWTIGKLSRLIAEYYGVILNIAVAVLNSTKTADKENKTASGLVSLMRVQLICCDIFFLLVLLIAFWTHT